MSHGATLTWDPNSEYDLAGYKLSFGIASGDYVWEAYRGKDVTEYPLPASWPGDRTYYITIQAYNTSGLYSEFSRELTYSSAGDADSDGIPDDEDPDDDDDGVDDFEDNCPDIPNGVFGTCKSGYFIGEGCIVDYVCGLDGLCSMDQEDTDNDGLGDLCDPDADGDGILNDLDDCPFDPDNDIDNDDICGGVDNCPDHYNPDQLDTYPPGGNGCGDACECLGDFDGSGDVGGFDAILFKENFLRKDCSELLPCSGDFDCDGFVDGTEAVLFKDNFLSKDCPTHCDPSGSENWCEY